ncbi:hypothetical protein FRC10_002694 [Ceratobasidium sp. 414]|nr:hypothetical protein FRC10_002694 [Ceratobasidium sp. 414]
MMIATPHIILTAFAVSLFGSAVALPSPTTTHANPARRSTDTSPFVKRTASCTFPTPPKTSSLSAPITVTGVFDGGNVRFDRGSGACNGQTEAGDSDAVFLVQPGGTIQNVVIGANQAEGIHCLGPCNLYNVWFEDVCERAITIKQTSGQSNIIGGGAKNAADEVIQHNGGGTVKIDSYFLVWNFDTLTLFIGSQYKRAVLISEIIGKNGIALASINSNYGDTALFDVSSLDLTNVTSICNTYHGNSNGNQPTKLTTNLQVLASGTYAE